VWAVQLRKRESQSVLIATEVGSLAYLEIVGRNVGERVEEPEMERYGFLAVLSNETTSEIAASRRSEPKEVQNEAIHIHRRGEVTWYSQNALVHGREVVRGHFVLKERVQSARNVPLPPPSQTL